MSRLAAIGQSGPRQVEAPSQDQLTPWADQIYQWIAKDRLQLTRIHELLIAGGCELSYQSLGRFVLKRNWRRVSKTTVRMSDTRPGEVAEADFGRLEMITDPITGRRQVVWGMVIVLCHSRHCHVWPMRQQKLADVIAGLQAAWAFFSGITRYLGIDNFPAAVAEPDPLHPRLTRGFLEYSQHRGFVVDPARTRHSWDKPKVERSVSYVKERPFGGGDFNELDHLRAETQRWCLEVAGTRIHGTARRQPLVVFQDEERRAMLPWDCEPYEITYWRTAKVHPDHHIPCLQALILVPAKRCRSGGGWS